MDSTGLSQVGMSCWLEGEKGFVMEGRWDKMLMTKGGKRIEVWKKELGCYIKF